MNKFLIIICIALASVMNAQVENSTGKSPYNYLPDFYVDIAEYKSQAAEQTRIDVFLQVPYSNLQFIKIQDGYQSRYMVTVTIMDEDKEKIILEKSWKESVFAKEFAETSSPKNSNISYKYFDIASGEYFLKINIEDLDSRKTSYFEQELKVRSFDSSINLSDIVLINKKINSPDGTQIIPNISKIFTNNRKTLDFFYEIYSDKDQAVKVEYQVLDLDENTKSSQTVKRELNKGANRIEESLNEVDLGLGKYNLIVKVSSETEDFNISSGKVFNSIIYGFPPSIRDLEKAVEQMVYIASPDDIDNILEADTYEEKLNRFVSWWKKMDPSPGTEENEILFEYYRRVEYANAKFNNYFEGWRSDMGMIYITLGPPNQVDRHPFDEDMKPYEVWIYYDIGKQFVFVDYTGFGDYRLYQPIYGDWYRYRQ